MKPSCSMVRLLSFTHSGIEMEASDEAKTIELVAFAVELGRFSGRARPGSHPVLCHLGVSSSRFLPPLSVGLCVAIRQACTLVAFSGVMSPPRAKDAYCLSSAIEASVAD
jgi:hypothetical protein